MTPSWVVAPSDTEALAALMKTAAEHDLTVVPRGEGTKLHWGSPPDPVDVIVDMVRLTGIYQHYADDLVATIGAGTPVRTVQALLASTGQRLAIDPGSADATIGGLLATGEAGPLRMRHGAPRDQLLGMEFVSADGTIAHSGGRVVKNVAGYDLGKLICGSFGTLAVIASATMRLQPLPAARAWVTRPVRTPLEVNDLVDDLLGEPARRRRRSRSTCPASGPGELAVLLEGSAAGVRTRVRDTIRLLGVRRHRRPPRLRAGGARTRSARTTSRSSSPLRSPICTPRSTRCATRSVRRFRCGAAPASASASRRCRSTRRCSPSTRSARRCSPGAAPASSSPRRP